MSLFTLFSTMLLVSMFDFKDVSCKQGVGSRNILDLLYFRCIGTFDNAGNILEPNTSKQH